MSDFRVFWVPQIPMKAFYVEVGTVMEGVKIMDVLDDYDAFQFKNHIKPDYCNIGGLEIFENAEWVSWYDEETGEDDPREWLRTLV